MENIWRRGILPFAPPKLVWDCGDAKTAVVGVRVDNHDNNLFSPGILMQPTPVWEAFGQNEHGGRYSNKA